MPNDTNRSACSTTLLPSTVTVIGYRIVVERSIKRHGTIRIIPPADLCDDIIDCRTCIASATNSDEFRQTLAARKIEACIPPKRNRKIQHAFDKQLYKTRHKIENMIGRLKDWRRISTRYDRCCR
jgi:transposase